MSLPFVVCLFSCFQKDTDQGLLRYDGGQKTADHKLALGEC